LDLKQHAGNLKNRIRDSNFLDATREAAGVGSLAMSEYPSSKNTLGLGSAGGMIGLQSQKFMDPAACIRLGLMSALRVK